MSSLKDRLRLSYVPRWAIVPTIRDQNVADHSWRVAMIADELAQELNLTHGANIGVNAVLRHALYHDIEEVVTGDVPSTIRHTPVLDAMREEDLVVKAADMLEALTWSRMWIHPWARNIVATGYEGKVKAMLAELDVRWRRGSDAWYVVMRRIEDGEYKF